MGYPPIKSMARFSSAAGRSVASGRRSRGGRGGRLTSGGTSGRVESSGLFDDDISSSSGNDSAVREEEFGGTSGSIPFVSLSVASENRNGRSLVCENCRREDYDGGISVEGVRVVKGVTGIGFAKLLSNMRYERGRDCYLLCGECQRYLKKDETKPKGEQYDDGSDHWKNTWPAYMWRRLLGNRRVVAERGISLVWRFVPVEWRAWWLLSVRRMEYQGADELTTESPSCYFTSVDAPMGDFLDWKREKRSKQLRKYWTENPVPCVHCPWGCSEYYHKAGGIALDHVIRKYLSSDVELQSFDVKGLNDAGRKKKNASFKFDRLLYGARADFLSANVETCEPKRATILDGGWERLAGLYMSEKGPMVLTCQRHDGGDYQKYVHVPVNPVNGCLADRNSDQLAGAVIKPWQLKFERKTAKGHSFEVREIRGGFHGFDTCDVSCAPRFDYKSWLGHMNDYLALNCSCSVDVQLDEYVGRGHLACSFFIFAFTRSTTNLLRTVPWGLAGYLTKYMTKINSKRDAGI